VEFPLVIRVTGLSQLIPLTRRTLAFEVGMVMREGEHMLVTDGMNWPEIAFIRFVGRP
jgi:hypothetical protein